MTDKEKLDQLISQADALLARDVTSTTTVFRGWKFNVERFLSRIYGKSSHEYESFSEISFDFNAKTFFLYNTVQDESLFELVDKQAVVDCHEGIEKAELLLISIQQDFDSYHKKIGNTKERAMVIRSKKSIDQMLEEDIHRCDLYLNNPDDETDGHKLYVEITGKYDRIISGFGNGLYQYIDEYHFYDPDIDKETLDYNLHLLLSKMISYQASTFPPITSKTNHRDNLMSNKVFIVHGHDNGAVQEMARTLAKGGYEPIILREQPDAGLTIIEKIEHYATVCYAVVLYTECDRGRDKNASVDQEKNRARQNVVFEHGYLIGKLGRERVCALIKGDVETPGDISGVVYTAMDTGGAWKIQLAKNMQAAGLSVDMNVFCS